jgi:formate/nitrite transporter
MNEPAPFDAVLPPAMARAAEDVGVAKAGRAAGTTFALAVLAGAFIALGAVFATTVATGTGALPYGVAKLLAGLVFSLGLILVVVAGAELFTGNNLIIMAAASGRITLPAVLRNWAIVFAGNAVGAVATAALVLAGGQWSFAGGEVGATALAIGTAKCRLGFGQAFALGILCNALVCLAVWLCLSARTTTDRILAIIFPITAFVACGFEHSIANLYFVPYALFLADLSPELAERALAPEARTFLTWPQFLVYNLIPVTLGNIVGGAGLVGAVYWWIYRRGTTPGA